MCWRPAGVMSEGSLGQRLSSRPPGVSVTPDVFVRELFGFLHVGPQEHSSRHVSVGKRGADSLQLNRIWVP